MRLPFSSRTILVLMFGPAALAGGSTVVDAQACLGAPTLPGQTAIGATFSFHEDAKGYGAVFTSNLAGPLAFGLHIERLDVDEANRNATNLAGSIAFELPVAGFSACPVAGIGRSTFRDTFDRVDVTVSRITIPLGLGIGKLLDFGDDGIFVPSGVLGLLFLRDRYLASFEGGRFAESEMHVEFGANIGATVGIGPFYGRGAVSATTFDEASRAVTLTFGILF